MFKVEKAAIIILSIFLIFSILNVTSSLFLVLGFDFYTNLVFIIVFTFFILNIAIISILNGIEKILNELKYGRHN